MASKGDATRRRQKERDKRTRRRLRERLEAEGVPEDEIARRVEELRRQHLEDRITSWWERNTPDDSKHRPQTVDPLQRGPARVTSRTAKAARRRKATTAYELNEPSDV